MISGLAHEINNPLTGVIGFANLLMEDGRAKPVQNELEIIQKNASRCKDIIDNLLDFVRPGKAEIEEIDVNELVQTSTKLIRRNLDIEGIEIQTTCDPELPTIQANRTQLEEVLINLLTNAEQELKEIEQSSRLIRVTTKPRDDDEIIIRIEDNGEGIPEEEREQIFEPFFTTKEDTSGTGLGLSISMGIINELGGTIEAGDSEELGGAQFDVKLPVRMEEDSLESKPGPDRRAESLPENLDRILVVDDEESIRELFEQFLDKHHLNGTFSKNPLEAIDHLELTAREAEPDIIVLDLVYPGQLEGRDLVRWIKENKPHLLDRIILITGNPHDHQLEYLQEHTDAPLLTKPLDMEELLNQMARVSRRHLNPTAE
ncbi:MAG: ATP-binding protein [bacterium]